MSAPAICWTLTAQAAAGILLGQWIELQRPDAHSKMSLPYLYIRTVQGDLVPWLASQTDMLAEDWNVVEPAQ